MVTHVFFLLGGHNFFPYDLFLHLNFEIFDIIHMLHQLIEAVLSSLEILFDLLLIFLHPLHQILFLFGLFLPPLLFFKLHVSGLSVSKVLLIDALAQLGGCFLRSNRDFSPVYIFDAGQVLGCSKISIPSKAWNFPTLSIVHFGIFDGSVVAPSQFLNAYLPIIELSQQSVDVIIECANLVLRASSVLNFFDFFDDIAGDLLPPLFALIEIGDFPNVANALGSLIILFVDESSLHGPPSVQHALGLLAVTGHSSLI